MNVLTRSLDRLVFRTPGMARRRAMRLAATAPERSFALFALAAEAGDPESAFAVAEHYLEGTGVMHRPHEAARWYHRAAELGHLGAQCRLAELLILGLPQGSLSGNAGLFPTMTDGGVDYQSAAFWARRAAEAGAPEAQATLAFILSDGPESLRDLDAAFEWYRKSALQNCPQGQIGYVIGLMRRAVTPEDRKVAHEQLLKAAGHSRMPTISYLLGLSAEGAIGRTKDEAAAREHYAVAAQAGLTHAQARLGLLLLEGRGGPTDQLNGESWLRRAALGGDNEAAALLGDIYGRSGTLPPNYCEAAHWFRIAAERGHRSAARSLGMLYLTGAGVARDPDEAAVWFKLAAEAGDPAAQADLASLMQSGLVIDASPETLPMHVWFEDAAEGGDLTGAYNFAVCLAEGVGVERDDQRAVHWLRRAAEGVVEAQYWYGRMLAEGRGIVQDDREAAVWLARAAEAGMAEAQLMLGEFHAEGRGMTRNHELAKAWFLRAISAGQADAMFALGALHEPGSDLPPDRDEALHWYAEAALHGHPMAALMVARYVHHGWAGARNVEIARRWYAEAASLGVPEAEEELASLDREMAGSPAPRPDQGSEFAR